MNKLVSQQLHAQKRAQERYGLNLTPDEYQKLNDLARSASVLQRRSNRLTLRKIFIEGYPVRVVYDSHREQIVTFLPQKKKDFENIKDSTS